MKLSIPFVLLSAASSAFAFSPSTSASLATSASSSALFASRKQQKIVSRTNWAEAKGYGSALAEETSSSGILTNDEGLEYIKLTSGTSSAEIYLFGADVTSYIKDGVEYIAVRPDAKMDGSKPISGG